MATTADAHAMIITSAGARMPSGPWVIPKPVDSIDKLFKLLDYRELGPAGLPPQVWITDVACELLGWGADDVDPGDENDYTDEQLRAGQLKDDVISRLDAVTHANLDHHLSPEGEDGWHLYVPHSGVIGHHIHLSRIRDRRTYMVDVILEPWAWTARSQHDRLGILGSESDGTAIDADDEIGTAREIGHRLTWHVQHLGVLPGNTAARTGAVIADRVYRDRKHRGKGIVVTTAGKMPPIDIADTDDLEPVMMWSRVVTTTDCEADRVVTIDQRASYLASAGMINLGYGNPSAIVGDAAEDAARQDTMPFGVWQVTLPPASTLALPEYLPLPHPRMRADTPVKTWLTSEGLKGLLAPVVGGGAGLDVGDLDVSEAWVFPDQGLVLKRWKEIIADARKTAVAENDSVMKKMVGDIYKGYLGRMANPEFWTTTTQRQHHQPLWRASIIAHARQRARVKATNLAAEHGIWPITALTDAWTYLVPGDLDIADELTYLGKYAVDTDKAGNPKDVPLTDEGMLALLSAEDEGATRRALREIFKSGSSDGQD